VDPVAGEIVGRSEALAVIGSFLADVATGGPALVVVGEPGLGKTTLLDHAAAVAVRADQRVLRTTAVEFETHVGLAGLHQLIAPVAHAIRALDAPHSGVLATVFGSGSSLSVDRLAIAAALRAMLREVSREAPVLVAVDDLHWLDRPSAGVLTLLVHQLPASVGFLGTTRPAAEGFFERARLNECVLSPLTASESEMLLDLRYPDLAVHRRRRVLASAMGNPLALVELPAAMSGSANDLPSWDSTVVPLNRRLQVAFSSRLDVMPETTRRSLLLAALEGGGSTEVLEAASDGRFVATLEPAERAGLVRLVAADSKVVFSHPLTRSAVVSSSTASERRRCHLRLAEALRDDPDRRASHLAQGAAGPDERAAASLEEAAYRLVRRGDAVGAVTALANASALSPERTQRARRLAAAAYVGAQLGGGLMAAGDILREARRLDPTAVRSLDAVVATSFVILNADGDVDTAHRILSGALDIVDQGSSSVFQVRAALHTLLYVCFFGARPELWGAFDAIASRVSDPELELMVLSRQTYVDPVNADAAAYQRLDELVASAEERSDPLDIIAISVAGCWTDRLGGCRAALRLALEQARESGDMNVATQALALLAFEAFFTGQWDEADRYITEALDLTASHGFRLYRWSIEYFAAAVAAVRGDDKATKRITDELLYWAVPRGVGIVTYLCHHARTLAAVGRRDYEEAYREATAISPAGVIPPFRPLAIWVVLDLVEAAVRTGRDEEARRHVAAVLEAGVARISGRTAMLAAAAQALVTDGDAAAEHFERALGGPRVSRWPFELARIELLYGEQLRRGRRPRAAREHLGEALAIFERLGAGRWADATRKELRAAGVRTEQQPEPGALTERELLIAQLAATGMSNKEIAAQLFVSARTIGAHLYRTFPKLGITSRAGLRDALDRLEETTAGRADA
jgi:DNA-binding CsgD family transcriptional regulator